MANLQVDTLEDCGCGTKKPPCKNCNDKNSGNYNVINIGNDILHSNYENSVENQGQNKETQIVHVPVEKKVGVPYPVIKNVGSDPEDLLVWADRTGFNPSVPTRILRSSDKKAHNEKISTYKEFY